MTGFMQLLTNTQLQVFALLRSSIWGVDRFPVQVFEGIDWEAVYKELKDQTVNKLVADVLCPMNTQVSQKCLMDTTYGMSLWHTYMREQQTLHTIFIENDIAYTILKGASAAINYPKPCYRSMGDIDVLVNPIQFDNAVQILSLNGYNVKKNNSSRHAEVFHNGLEIEIHKCYSMFSDRETFIFFENELLEGLNKVTPVQVDGYRFNMLGPCENGLVFLEHIDHHLQGGIGLRQIIDWMLYVDKHVTDAFWQNILEPKIRKTGLKTLAITVTRMCQMYLGLREDITWCNGADDQLATELISIILARGNFGHKEGSANRIATVLHSTSGVKGTFRLLQYRGEMLWPALKKHPWLRPFAWMYQLCRYIREGLKVKNPLKSFAKQARETSKQKELFEKLGATKKSDGIETLQGKRF